MIQNLLAQEDTLIFVPSWMQATLSSEMKSPSSEKNNRLGKGLDKLLGPNPIDSESVIFLDIERIQPSKNQPRKFFDKDRLEELAASIKKHGVLQPILVRAHGENYEIIAGERRWRSALLAGLHKIPALLKNPKNFERRAGLF